jgi:indolepyruvate ferredoxin oxidoreductase alpha subunit
MGETTKRVMIEDIARTVGVEQVEVVDAYDVKAAQAAFERMLKAPGVAMVISRRICATEAIRQMRPKRPMPWKVNLEKCTGCKHCVSTFGCTAISYDDSESKALIDPTICMGCGTCSQVCPVHAIERSE